ncbi:hypothetical protein [Gordonia sp. NPDC003376]
MAIQPNTIADAITNRGTAFTAEERTRLGLIGRLPSAVETLDDQVARAYKQIGGFETALEKYNYLNQLHDRNEVLYHPR